MKTDIVYGDTIIAEVDEKQSATIKCLNRLMHADVEILFTGDGNVQYGDAETPVTAGQKITLPCADKRMAHDLVVNLLNIIYRKITPQNRTALITADNQTFLTKEK